MLNDSNKKLIKTRHLEHHLWRKDNWRDLRPVYPNVADGELEEYINEVFFSPAIIYSDRGFVIDDGGNDKVAIFGGMRRAVGLNGPIAKCGSQETPRIYMFGDSRMYGLGVEDRDTLASCLQRLLDRSGVPAKVLNCGIIGNTLINILSRIKSLNFSRNDIIALFLTLYAHREPENDFKTRFGYNHALKLIIEEAASKKCKLAIFKFPDIRRLKKKTRLETFFQENVRLAKKYCLLDPHFTPSTSQDVDFIDTQDALDAVPAGISSFWDHNHLGPAAQTAIADFIFPHIHALYNEAGIQGWKALPLTPRQRLHASARLNGFLESCRKKVAIRLETAIRNSTSQYHDSDKFQSRPGEIIGAIVANCNPFTNGHIYLVSEALKLANYLYLFVVSEDRSFFSFEHRLEMVRNHYAGDRRIRVLPAGTLTASTITIPEYFERNILVDNITDYTRDINCFKDILARIFHIDVRFVGSEPNSPFMSGYNAALKEILPRHGIDVVEIARKSNDQGRSISASDIRAAIQDNNLARLEHLVPASTLRIINRFYLKSGNRHYGNNPHGDPEP